MFIIPIYFLSNRYHHILSLQKIFFNSKIDIQQNMIYLYTLAKLFEKSVSKTLESKIKFNYFGWNHKNFHLLGGLYNKNILY